MKNISKRELDLLLNRDQKVFVKFYKMYAPKLVDHINCYVKNVEEAKDITEDIFINFYKLSRTYDRNKSNIFTWLCAIGKNKAIDYLNKENNVTIHEFDDKIYGVESKPNFMLLDLKEIMDEDDYNIMCLKYIEGLTAKEVSVIMNVSERTIFRKLKIIEEIVKDYVEVNGNE